MSKKIYITAKCLIVIGLIVFMWLILALKEKPVDYNCTNFKTYKEALKVFNQSPTDIYHLDGNHNGVPCEMLIDK